MNIEAIMKTMKILYVEDEKEAREEMVDVLKRRAGKVYVADNGKKGLSLFEDYEPDIVIADLYMPEMSGREMIRRIKESGANPAVIVISAVGDVDTILSAIDVGIDKYILKPVNLQELLKILEEQAEDIFNRRQYQMSALPENRKQVEDGVKREFATFLKTSTGKGPRDVNVFVTDDRIELTASEVMTTLERSLFNNGRNPVIVKYIREMFFSSKEKELCRMSSRLSGREVLLKDVRINVDKDKNKLIFAAS